MRDEAVDLDDFLAEYNSTIGSVPDKNDLPFQIVVSSELQRRMLEAVLVSRSSGKEAAAQLVFSDSKNGADLINWATGKSHSIAMSTAVTGEYHYRGTFHTHPPELKLPDFKGMGYPPSASDINELVRIQQNLISIVAVDDRKSSYPEVYLLVKTKQSRSTIGDKALEDRVTAAALAASGGGVVKYGGALKAYRAVVLELCTHAFVGCYWGFLAEDGKGAIILQNLGPSSDASASSSASSSSASSSSASSASSSSASSSSSSSSMSHD